MNDSFFTLTEPVVMLYGALLPYSDEYAEVVLGPERSMGYEASYWWTLDWLSTLRTQREVEQSVAAGGERGRAIYDELIQDDALWRFVPGSYDEVVAQLSPLSVLFRVPPDESQPDRHQVRLTSGVTVSGLTAVCVEESADRSLSESVALVSARLGIEPKALWQTLGTDLVTLLRGRDAFVVRR